jgi:hypothetical protein
MNTQLIVQTCKSSAAILADMDGETPKSPKKNIYPLIFPEKKQKSGKIHRVSEQELRLMFIQELELADSSISYSIETPTRVKYRLGKDPSNYSVTNPKRRSALVDLTLFDFTTNKKYKRILNIEFKHSIKKELLAKDVFKLINEKEDGALIILLNNSNKGTFVNKAKNNGLFNKLQNLLSLYSPYWHDQNKKLLFVIMSISKKDRIMIYHEVSYNDLNTLSKIFNQRDMVSIDKIAGWNTTTF